MNRAWIELSKKALDNNIAQMKSFINPSCKVIGVVKANGYGHGAALIANYLQKQGIDFFAAATEGEAIELRKSGITGNIIVLGYTSLEKVPEMMEYRIIQALVSPEYAKQLSEAALAQNNGEKLLAHIALDTGMHRIGFYPEDLEGIKAAYELKGLDVCGIFSHLCVADSEEQEQIDFTNLQIKRYLDTVNALKAMDVKVGTVHLQNSYGTVNYGPLPCDYARFGILMYGVRAENGDYLNKQIDLEPVMTLKARIGGVREIQPGETVGYGRTFTATAPTKIATVTIGYADGIPRNMSGGKLKAIVNGVKVPVAGRICMDQMMLDVTNVENVKAGDVAVLIGKDGNECITAEEQAEAAGTITNEFLGRLSTRIENRGFVD